MLYFDTTHGLWNDLVERFGQSNKGRPFQVQKDVSCLTQGDLDIANYFTKAKQLWDESNAVSAMPLCTCAKCECGVNGKLMKYTEEQRLIQFLMGLNSSYTAVRGNILMMSPLPNLSQAYSHLVQEERQRQVRTEAQFLTENASFSIRSNPGANTKPPFQRKSDGKRSQLYCDHCKRSGHTIDKCYKIHGYPDAAKPHGRGRGGYTFQNQNRRAYNAWSEQEPQINRCIIPYSARTESRTKQATIPVPHQSHYFQR